MKMTITPFFLKLVLSAIGIVTVSILMMIVTGTFAPLQTSIVTEVGICMGEDVYEQVLVIPTDTDILYICGTLEGDTKRYVGFDMLYSDKSVFFQSLNLPPGEFYVPVKATDLHYVDMSRFPEGNYRGNISYSRDPFIEFFFRVESP